MKKMSKKEIETRIQRVFGARCSNIQIPIMETVKVWDIGRKAILEGVDDAALGDRMLAYVETISCN